MARTGRAFPTRVILGERQALDASAGAGVAKTSGTTLTGTGTGYATLAVDTSRSISWNQPSTGSDSQTTITSANSAGDGWAVGINVAYGGMPFSAWYERLGGSDVNPAMQNGVAGGSGLTQLPTNPANQNSQHTGPTYPAGHLDAAVQESTLGYGAAEMVQSFTLTELAPTGTSLRRRYHASGTVNSITYDLYATVYPGEPGAIFWRTVITGPGSALSLNPTPEGGLIQATPAALLPSGGTLPEAGLWHLDGTHAVYGSLGALGTTTAIPTSPTEATSDPDLVALVPTTPAGNVATLASQRLGIVVARFTKYADVGLSSPALAGYENTDRVKIVSGGQFSGNSMPANTVITLYTAEFLTGGISAGGFANAFALAADYLQPGTPTVSVGTLTTFSYPGHAAFPFNLEEGCYVVAAAANAATITLDLGGTVAANLRYKPRFKLTGLTALTQTNGSEISLTLAGTSLTAGTDYAITVDTTNQIAYVQVMFDLIASGAGSGQKNNGALAFVAVPQVAGTFALGGGVTLALTGTAQPAVVAGTVALVAGALVSAAGSAVPTVVTGTFAITTGASIGANGGAVPTVVAGTLALPAGASLTLTGSGVPGVVNGTLGVTAGADVALGGGAVPTTVVGAFGITAGALLAMNGAASHPSVQGAFAIEAGAEVALGGAAQVLTTPGTVALAAGAVLTMAGSAAPVQVGGTVALAAGANLSLSGTPIPTQVGGSWSLATGALVTVGGAALPIVVGGTIAPQAGAILGLSGTAATVVVPGVWSVQAGAVLTLQSSGIVQGVIAIEAGALVALSGNTPVIPRPVTVITLTGQPVSVLSLV